MQEMPLKAVIIDDESEAIIALESLVKEQHRIVIVGSNTNPEKALQLVLKTKPDIVFLDIQMPGLDGFEVLKELHDHSLNPYIIFTTAYDKHAIRAIKAGAFDYLLKPVDPVEIAIAIEKVQADKELHSLEQQIHSLEVVVRNHRKLKFNTRSGYLLIHPDDILYIEADSNYSEIYLLKEKREVVSMNLGAVEELLPVQFIRISRSLIINSHFIIKVSGVNKRCTLKKGDEEKEFSVPEKNLPELKRVLGE